MVRLSLLLKAPSIQDDELTRFRALIHRETGIVIGDKKEALLVARLAPRLRAHGIDTFTAYYRLVTAPEGGPELARMIDCICTNETRFFREPRQFELLEREVIPSLSRGGSRPIRVWSAACSTGEEPYSAAMSLLHHLPPRTARIEILATDLSTRALAHAQQATWPIERAAEIPAAYLHKYMLEGRGPHGGKMKAGPELRELVTFRRMNLIEEPSHLRGPFDLILCRNVLMYFDPATRERVLGTLLERLRPQGYLFLGHSETLSGASTQAARVMPAVYQKRPRAPASS